MRRVSADQDEEDLLRLQVLDCCPADAAYFAPPRVCIAAVPFASASEC